MGFLITIDEDCPAWSINKPMDAKIKFDQIRSQCEAELADLQMWPHYYRLRYLEFLSYFDLLPKKSFDSILEIGCGNGYYSAFFSQMAKKVVATNQPSSEIGIHTKGLDQTSELIKKLGLKNVEVLPASADSLPFADQSFDLVFSSHVLSYVKDQEKAIKEMNRVLRPNGLHVCIVPSSMATFLRLFDYWAYLVKRSFYYLIVRPKPSTTGSASTPTKKSLGTFPFPQTHGAQPTWWQELKATQPKIWKKTITRNGAIPLVLQQTTQVNFFMMLIAIISPKSSVSLHSKTRKLENQLGKTHWLQPLGLNSILITEAK